MCARIQWLTLLVVVLLTGCASESAQETIAVAVAQTLAAAPSAPPLVQTVEVPVTRVITQVMLVTATATSTPLNSPTPTLSPTITATPTITPTPTQTPLPTATPDLALTATIEAYGLLAQPKNNGIYRVGTEILPGKWESQGSGSGCYWERLDDQQEINGNYFGAAGGTVTVLASDYEVLFSDCGQWVYVEGMVRELLPTAGDPKGDGIYTVGVEILPGKWESQGSGDSCYWERLDDKQEINGNYFGPAGGTVTILSADYEVLFNECGQWIYTGP
jgi:hypothetical protein